jgi:hypothetical protein
MWLAGSRAVKDGGRGGLGNLVYGGIGVSQSALTNAWSNPLKIEYVPSKYGPTFRYTGTDTVIVVNADGKVVTGWAKSSSGTGK